MNLLSRIKANIFQSYLYINFLENEVYSVRFLRRLKNKSSMFKRFFFKRISSILIPKSSAKNTRKMNSKRRNRTIFRCPTKYYSAARERSKLYIRKTTKTRQLFWDKSFFNCVIIIMIIILLKFKFNRFLNLHSPHIASLIEAGCVTYNKIHNKHITLQIHYIIIKFRKKKYIIIKIR